MRLLRPRLSLPPKPEVPPRLEEPKLKLSDPTGRSPTLEVEVPPLVLLLLLLVAPLEMPAWTGLPILVLPTGLPMIRLLLLLLLLELLLPPLAGSKSTHTQERAFDRCSLYSPHIHLFEDERLKIKTKQNG